MTTSGPTIRASCPAGRITGLDRDATLVFKGVQFAGAPRLNPADDVESWSGTYDATAYRPQAPQNPSTIERLLGGSPPPMAEDCLHLNIHTPACDAKRRPVLFWLHGGSFLTGGGAVPWYDGSRLAARGDVVVVTINYRLGALGFLGTRNTGITDQISALRWVERNIEAFGGSPDNVTVFGESAGGCAAIALLATPHADTLFQRAWAMSPSIPQIRTSAHGEHTEQEFLNALQASDCVDPHKASIEDLLTAQAATDAKASGNLKTFSPTEGTDAIPEPILDVVATDHRPLVMGSTRDEWSLFSAFDSSRANWNRSDIEREFARRFPDDPETAIELYSERAPGVTASQLVSAMQTDEIFRGPIWSLIEERVAKHSLSSSWMYAFDYASPSFGGILGSCHALDIPFAFDNLHQPGVDAFAGSGDNRQGVADQFSNAIISFAKHGNPGWEQYAKGTRATQRIGPQPKLLQDPDEDLRCLWQHRRDARSKRPR